MTLREAIEMFKSHQKNSVRNKTRESYGHLFRNLEVLLGNTVLDSISSQDLYQFLLLLTEGRARSTARLRYAQLKTGESYNGPHGFRWSYALRRVKGLQCAGYAHEATLLLVGKELGHERADITLHYCGK